MIVLDTDVVSTLMRSRPSPSLLARIAQVPLSEQATTAVTVGELAYGASRVGRPEIYQRALGLLTGVRILAFDRAAAEEYGRIRADLERAGARLADPDLRIAATVLAHRATLATGNVRHFEGVLDLEVVDWLRS